MVAGRSLNTWEIHLRVANFRCEASPSKGARGSNTLNTHTQSDTPLTLVMYSSFIPAGCWDSELGWHGAPGCAATQPWAFCWCKFVNKGYLMKLKRAPSLLCLTSPLEADGPRGRRQKRLGLERFSKRNGRVEKMHKWTRLRSFKEAPRFLITHFLLVPFTLQLKQPSTQFHRDYSVTWRCFWCDPRINNLQKGKKPLLLDKVF